MAIKATPIPKPINAPMASPPRPIIDICISSLFISDRSTGMPQAKRMKRYNMPKHKTRTYDGDHSLSWISPDDLWLTDDQDWREENAYWEDEWPKPDLTFVYKDGVLHKAPGKNTHGSIGRSVPEFNTIARGELAEIALLGRVGTACVCSGCGLTVNNCRHGQECDKAYPERKLVASFWNLDDLKELGIDACLNELEDQGFIERGTLVSTPLGTYKYSGEHRAKEATNGDRDRTRLLQQMHLARGDEKKSIMKKLGLGNTTRPKTTQYHFGGGDNPAKGQPGKWWSMHGDSLDRNGNVISENKKYTPDDLYDTNNATNVVPFVYTGVNLYVGDHYDTHWDILIDSPEIFNELGIDISKYHNSKTRRDAVDKFGLTGRIGVYQNGPDTGRQIIAFWSDDESIFEIMFDGLMDELANEGLLKQTAIISTPFIRFEWPDTQQAARTTPDERTRIALQQRMHLARGNEKKEIMRQLGVGKSEEEPEDRMSTQWKKRYPGHYWGMTSDSVEHDVVPILESYTTWLDPDTVFGKGEEPEGKMSTQWKKHNAGHYWGMTSDSIEIPGEVIIERIDDENEDYIDPNIICNIETPDECCFIFTDKLYFHKGVECHSGLVRKQPAILTDIGFVKNTSDLTERKALHDRSLLGRIATVPDSLPESVFHNLEEKLGDYVGIQIVSFWTTNRQLYDNLDECMAALDSHGLLAETSLISTPFGNRMWPDGAEIESDELTPEERERIELLQQMHLARGDVKKEIMDKLGLGFEGRPKNKIQTHHNGGDDPTRGAPGKWWSPFGDDINRIANAINENL